jgi:hemoglobin
MPESQIASLVRLFYERARAHPQLGPFFETAITDWDHHLRVVEDFWSHALLGTQRYKGHPFPAHVDIGIQREHFDLWLSLFRPAATETLSEDLAHKAIARAEHMAESFRAGLFPFDKTSSH